MAILDSQIADRWAIAEKGAAYDKSKSPSFEDGLEDHKTGTRALELVRGLLTSSWTGEST